MNANKEWSLPTDICASCADAYLHYFIELAANKTRQRLVTRGVIRYKLNWSPFDSISIELIKEVTEITGKDILNGTWSSPLHTGARCSSAKPVVKQWNPLSYSGIRCHAAERAVIQWNPLTFSGTRCGKLTSCFHWVSVDPSIIEPQRSSPAPPVGLETPSLDSKPTAAPNSPTPAGPCSQSNESDFSITNQKWALVFITNEMRVNPKQPVQQEEWARWLSSVRPPFSERKRTEAFNYIDHIHHY